MMWFCILVAGEVQLWIFAFSLREGIIILIKSLKLGWKINTVLEKIAKDKLLFNCYILKTDQDVKTKIHVVFPSLKIHIELIQTGFIL